MNMPSNKNADNSINKGWGILCFVFFVCSVFFLFVNLSPQENSFDKKINEINNKTLSIKYESKEDSYFEFEGYNVYSEGNNKYTFIEKHYGLNKEEGKTVHYNGRSNVLYFYGIPLVILSLLIASSVLKTITLLTKLNNQKDNANKKGDSLKESIVFLFVFYLYFILGLFLNLLYIDGLSGISIPEKIDSFIFYISVSYLLVTIFIICFNCYLVKKMDIKEVDETSKYFIKDDDPVSTEEL